MQCCKLRIGFVGRRCSDERDGGGRGKEGAGWAGSSHLGRATSRTGGPLQSPCCTPSRPWHRQTRRVTERAPGFVVCCGSARGTQYEQGDEATACGGGHRGGGRLVQRPHSLDLPHCELPNEHERALDRRHVKRGVQANVEQGPHLLFAVENDAKVFTGSDDLSFLHRKHSNQHRPAERAGGASGRKRSAEERTGVSWRRGRSAPRPPSGKRGLQVLRLLFYG